MAIRKPQSAVGSRTDSEIGAKEFKSQFPHLPGGHPGHFTYLSRPLSPCTSMGKIVVHLMGLAGGLNEVI